ncbi:MAG: putative metalloprotease [Paraglaciecola sp.]|jgi:predicted metalloprotease
MRWQGRQGSDNVDDRRAGGTAKKVGGGIIGIGTILLVIFALIMGENPLQYVNLAGAGGGGTQTTQTAELSEQEVALGKFVSVVLKETEDVWNELFPKQLNRRYVEPGLVLFTGQDKSACGFASAATGPFYCPADQKVYIDLEFYNTLQKRFGASGDFAMAYVVGHEVGHHVQNLLGITSEVSRQKGRVPEAQYNNLSVRLELQADFLAGVWAHHMQKNNNILEEGDFEEAMNAAHAIGDDNIQKRSRGYVVPESFTHGSSEQRMRWFRKGFTTGDLSQGDTFKATDL